MSKPIRPGAKPLQIRASAWVHKVIEQQAAFPGVEKWMVVERLMRAGLEAEGKSGTPRQPWEPQPLDWREHKEFFLIQTFFRAEQCLELFFANDVPIFMRTIRQVHEEKLPLPASEWKRWKKLQQIPEAYIPTLLKVLMITDGISRTGEAYVSAKLRGKTNRRSTATR